MNISFTGMEHSAALKKYLEEKISKHEELFKDINTIDVVFKENVHAKGIDKDFILDINVLLPKALVRVEERGPDMYAIIDKGTDILFRRLRRYYDRKENWEGVTPWKVLEAQDTIEEAIEEEISSFADYAPRIARRVKLENMTPMSEGEAIEKMELMGDMQILFKNSETGKISMIYSAPNGEYVMVEPSENLSL
ncbi:ribosome-associated translation inhibitor RaiA [Candidatus Dojkabacteria bacterium]|nr:ribosome-associated translation inhibitor RaiA [Candidatus Dojkabacteria bacterium]